MPTEGQAPHVRFITPGPGAVVPTNIKSWYFEFNKPIQANSLQNNVQMRKVTFNSTSMTDSTAMTGPTFTPVNGLMVTPIVDQASPNLA
ncbi:MAG: hypothetical protein ACYC3E_00845, partial [Carboxydocellales bacterium]